VSVISGNVSECVIICKDENNDQMQFTSQNNQTQLLQNKLTDLMVKPFRHGDK
jgi:hypothetical protein